jgi:hypothetical protein
MISNLNSKRDVAIRLCGLYLAVRSGDEALVVAFTNSSIAPIFIETYQYQ